MQTLRKNRVFRFVLRLTAMLLSLAVFVVVAPRAFAQSPDPAADLAVGINVMWMIIGGFLVFFMQGRLRAGGNRLHPHQERSPHHDDEHDGVLHRRVRLLADGLRLPVRRSQLFVRPRHHRRCGCRCMGTFTHHPWATWVASWQPP